MKSIVTEYTNISAFSQNPRECDHHLIYGSGLRKLADEDGLTIPLTKREHNLGNDTEKIHGNQAAEKLSKMVGQLAYEKEFYKKALGAGKKDPAREAFRKRYGISYL